ncbi:MAG: PhzF family phenazine biosynthesis protein [Vulcanimicrobiaceae bacterium]
MTYEMLQVDAFTSHALGGNPCAIYPDARGLSDELMQRIAREMNLSETSYVLPSERADFRVRYFTPAYELPMAGHPTIATTHALCELGRIKPDARQITLEMPAGIIPVSIDRAHEHPRFIMRQLAPKFLRTYSREALADALGLSVRDLRSDATPQTVSTGVPQLMIALASVEALGRIRADVRTLLPGQEQRDYASVHVFARDSGEVALRSRHFADFNGLVEDPFTGSASGGMAAYCARYGLVEASSYAIAQGEHAGRPGTGYIRVLGTPDAIEGVEVGGEAVTVLRGTLVL